MDDLKPRPRRKLRTGYTTGACATACVKGALLGFIHQKKIKEVTVDLPIGQRATFQLTNQFWNDQFATCTTIKDAGDDPDITDKAKITAKITLNDTGEIIFKKGAGVGVVTLAGIGLEVGTPAINPVPRKMMTLVCSKILSEQALHHCGVVIEISVANGAQMARKTLNPRMGILGGISILGTTGIVVPYSDASYIASIIKGVDIAVVNHADHLLLSAGKRSEHILRTQVMDLPDFACIHYGNWIRETLVKIVETHQIKSVTMGMMLGKAVKLAEGQLNTHSGQSTWNPSFVCELALSVGISGNVAKQILDLKMASRLTFLLPPKLYGAFYQKIKACCKRHCQKVLKGRIDLSLLLIDHQGNIF